MRDDINWLKRTITSWPDPEQTLPTVTYEPIDILEMELPPGWRGYGKRNIIENPDSMIQQAKIDAIRNELLARGADRFAIQKALMPYEHLLPEKYRGRNERLYERFDDEKDEV
jgi:fumarate reductase flavoprotein subunit